MYDDRYWEFLTHRIFVDPCTHTSRPRSSPWTGWPADPHFYWTPDSSRSGTASGCRGRDQRYSTPENFPTRNAPPRCCRLCPIGPRRHFGLWDPDAHPQTPSGLDHWTHHCRTRARSRMEANPKFCSNRTCACKWARWRESNDFRAIMSRRVVHAWPAGTCALHMHDVHHVLLHALDCPAQ